MDSEIKGIMGELCRAINDSLKGAPRIMASVERLQGLGYDLALFLEATVILSHDAKPRPRRVSTRRAGTALAISEKDKQYLKSLKITLAGEPAKTRRPKLRAAEPDEP